MNNVLIATNIKKDYGKGKEALRGVDLELKKGEILGLLGPNGAGKTTLIKILATLLSKNEGEVNILGYDLDKNANEIRHLLGYVGQDTERSAYARLSPLENLRFFGALRGISKDVIDDKVHYFAERFGFEDVVNKQFMHLSGGQKQAVVIMRSLLHDPPIIYLDEPTKGLDPFAANNIRKFLKEYATKEGKSLILTSHILQEVDYMADRCSLINKGIISITDTPEALKDSVGARDFVELAASDINEKIINSINSLDSVITQTTKEDGKWISFGVSDVFDGTEAIFGVLKKEGVKAGFRQHTLSLEDAFIHHIGAFKDAEEVKAS